MAFIPVGVALGGIGGAYIASQIKQSVDRYPLYNDPQPKMGNKKARTPYDPYGGTQTYYKPAKDPVNRWSPSDPYNGYTSSLKKPLSTTNNMKTNNNNAYAFTNWQSTRRMSYTRVPYSVDRRKRRNAKKNAKKTKKATQRKKTYGYASKSSR